MKRLLVGLLLLGACRSASRPGGLPNSTAGADEKKVEATGQAQPAPQPELYSLETYPDINPNAPADDVVYTYVEQMPEFPGGNGALIAFLEKKVQYPDLARRNGVEGKVYVKFVVDKTGVVTNPEIVKGLADGCNEEVLRVVHQLPRFTPGRQNGHLVRVYYMVSVPFRLNP